MKLDKLILSNNILFLCSYTEVFIDIDFMF